KKQVMHDAQNARIAAMPVNSALDVLKDPHLRARRYWEYASHPEAGRLPYTGPSWRMHNNPKSWQLQRVAPMLGQHNVEVFTGMLGLSRQDLVVMRSEGAI